MATAAWRLEVEKTVEQRLERLEVHVEHIQSDITEIKSNVREMDQRLTRKIDALEEKLAGKIDNLIQAVSDLKVGRFVERVWYMLMSAGLLWVMAKAFKWI